MSQNILITTSTFGKHDEKPLDILKKAGYKCTVNPFGRKVEVSELLDLVNGSVGMIAGTEDLSAAVLEKFSGVKVISRCGVGLDNVDMDKAKDLGIKVFNTPQGPTLAVAELVLGLILDLLRNVSLSDRQLRAGQWQKHMGNLFFGKTVGIIGFGQIGRKVAELSKALGANIVYYDPFVMTDDSRSLSLNELLQTADIVTLHTSFSPDNKNLIGQEQIAQMKANAYLINCSRGGIVEEEALYQALKNQSIAGAAIDVFAKEPYDGPLKDLDNVILTPHIGSYAKEARIQMEIDAVENLLKGLRGEE